MRATSPPMPATDLPGYVQAYAEEMAFGTDDPATVLDRYHAPELEWFNDGLLLDRERLLKHVDGVRRRGIGWVAFEFHGHTVNGDRVGAHYTMSSEDHRGRELSTEIFMVGVLAPDGRLSRIEQVTAGLVQTTG